MAGTIKDIARITGLGLATISSYLNGGTVRENNRMKIEAAIEELNFEVNEVARGLKTNKTMTVGVIIPELNNIFCAEIITEMEDILRNQGYATIVCDCRTDKALEKKAVDFLYRKRVDGIINMPVNSDGAHLKQFLKTGKPIVTIDRKIEGIECDSVLVDNLAASRNAVDYLISQGHTRIGIICGPAKVYTAEERLLGYKLALMQAGIEMDEALIASGDFTMDGGVKCLEELYHRNKGMTALYVTNYEMTLGTMIAVNRLNIKIPEQLSVIGFDNLDFARAYKPSLRIVTQPTKEIARYSAQFMLERLNNESKEFRSIKLQTELSAGESVSDRRTIKAK